jgi:hypothetical protein
MQGFYHIPLIQYRYNFSKSLAYCLVLIVASKSKKHKTRRLNILDPPDLVINL